MASDRTSDHYEDANGRGFFQGTITPKDRDTAGGASNERTERIHPLPKSMKRTTLNPRGKQQK